MRNFIRATELTENNRYHKQCVDDVGKRQIRNSIPDMSGFC